MLISRGSFATLNINQHNFHSSPDYSSLIIHLVSPGLSRCSPAVGVGPPPRHDDRPDQSHHHPGCGHSDVPLPSLSSPGRQEGKARGESQGDITVLLSYYFPKFLSYKYKEKYCKMFRLDFFC